MDDERAWTSRRGMARLFWVVGLFSLLTVVGIGEYGYRVARHFLEERREDMFVRVRNHLIMFDHMLSLIEREMSEHAEKAIASVTARLLADGWLGGPGSFPADEFPLDYLKELAIAHGVSDISLIDRRGKVYASSLPQDVNRDLFAFSRRFEEFLQGIYGRGKIVGHDILPSISTGRLTLFRYYGPPGTDVIVEVWIDLKEYITLAHSADQYDFMFHRFFLPVGESDRYVKGIDLFTSLGQPGPKRSLLHEGRSFEGGEDLIQAVERHGEVRVGEGDHVTIYRIIRVESVGGVFNPRVMVKLEYDFSSLAWIRWRIIRDVLLVWGGTMAGLGAVFLASGWPWKRRKSSRGGEADAAAESGMESGDADSLDLLHLSHDMRTPLNAVIGFSELLSRHVPQEGPAREYLEIIRRAGADLSNVINALLEEGRGRYVPSGGDSARPRSGVAPPVAGTEKEGGEGVES